MSAPEGLLKVTRVVSAPCVRESDSRVTISVPGHECTEEPRIELIREGEVIRAVDVACPCGRRLRVMFEFAGLVSR